MKAGNFLYLTKSLLSGLIWLASYTSLLAGNELHALPMAVNAAPVLGKIESADLLYQRASGGVSITNSIAITDADSKNLRSAAIRITDGYHSDEDILRFKNQNGINGFWNKNTGILSLTGSSTLAHYQTALRSIQYENTNLTSPSTDKRKVTFTVNDGLNTSNTVSRNIIIIIPDLSPVLGGLETARIIYCPSSGMVPVTSSLTVSDGDDDNLSSAKIQITGKYTSGEDFLRFSDQSGITGSWETSSGILTLTGVAAKAIYQDALRSIRYENTNPGNPLAGVHTVSFSVNDGKVSGNVVSRDIYVNGPVSAVLSGTATLCGVAGTDVSLKIDLKGTAPWNFTLTRDNANEKNYTNVTQDPYSFSVNQEGTYRIKSLADANCTGDTSGSSSVTIKFNTPPTAVLSGSDTICQDGTAEISIALTGQAPWNITYSRNGSNPTVISNINTSNYMLKVTSAGTYTLTALTDALCTNGRVSGTATVVKLNSPTATLSGDASICANTSAELNVSLTGVAPWSFSYKLDNGTPVSMQDVEASPKTFGVSRAGNYTLVEVFDKFCKGSVSGSARIQVKPSPVVSLTGLAPAYNKDSSQLIPLTGTPSGGIFSGPGVIPYNNDWYFLTSLPPVGTHNIVYAYRDSPSSCYGYDTVVVRVMEASAVIDFPENRTTICRNDGPVTIKAVNLNNSNGHFTISGDIGLTDNGNNTATFDPQSLGASEYTITYTYTDGVVLSVKKSFEIGEAPVADFTWESECFEQGQSTSFKNTSGTTFGNLTGYLWTIRTEGRTDSMTTENIDFTFPDAGRYDISLTVNTSHGCTDGISKIIGLSSPIELAGQPYFEDFEDSSFYWHTGNESSKPANSWELSDTSKGFPRAKSGRLFWHTTVPSGIAPAEDSWVISPCFDFSGTQRPMVILDTWRKFNNLRDGAVLQVTADSGKSWNNVGDLNDGINWFDSYGISGKPGGQGVGWSNIMQSEWQESRHELDMLRGKSRVQFRMAYGSDGALNSTGIAFDNFNITERDRTVLLEHFTNSADPASKIADSTLNDIVLGDSADLVDLQYHTSFPGPDPFNIQEPYVPSARLLYYGLLNVPYTIMNGGTEPSYRFDYQTRPLSLKPLKNQSLDYAKFRIRLYSELINNNTLYIKTWITAMSDMPSREYTIHVGVVEREITGESGTNGETEFKNVVKTLLPDAGGKTIIKAWNKNEADSLQNVWYLQNVYNMNELRVFAFIQDESNSEVFQVALENVDFVTGIKDPSSADNSLLVYPNPASNTVFVKPYKPVSGIVRIVIYNDLGVLVKSAEMPGSADQAEISTASLPDGIYVLRAVSGTSILGTQLLNVSH